MSADNWAQCPKCLREAEKSRKKLQDKAAKAYGKETPEVYLALREKAERNIELESTLREDYHIGIDDGGTFSVDYSASCRVCNFLFNYKIDVKTETL